MIGTIGLPVIQWLSALGASMVVFGFVAWTGHLQDQTKMAILAAWVGLVTALMGGR